MKKICCFLIVIAYIFFPFSAFSKAKEDSLKINFSELNFSCNSEKYAVQKDFQNTDSILKWVLEAECKQNLVPSISGVQDLVQKFKEKNITNKYTKEKFIKDVYKAVHEKFLVTYSLNVPFSKIFEDGTYNCVTASILYSVIFEQLNINYEIHETPTHVYLVAEPQTLNITIETTAPTFGYMTHDETFKARYLKFLIDNKIISKEEEDTSTTSNLFNRHFYNDNSITVRELVGLLYCNKGIDLYQKEKFRDALSKFEISYFIYPCSKTKFLIEAIVREIILKNENLNNRNINDIVKLAAISDTSDNNSMLKELFQNITVELTEKNPDIERYKLESEMLFAAIKDTLLLKDLEYVHYMSIGLHAYFLQDNSMGIEYFNKALDLFPNNTKVKGLLTEIVTKQLYDIAEEIDEPKIMTDTLLSLVKQYPMLKKVKLFQYMLTASYSELLEEEFEFSNKTAIDTYLNDFDKKVQSNLYENITDEVVAATYIEAHIFFLRKNNFAQAKEYLKRGLKLSPDNDMLKEKLDVIKKSGY